MKTSIINPNTPQMRHHAARLGAIAAAALLGLSAQAQTPTFTNVWSITNNSYTDLPASGDTVRGVAISPITTNVVYVSRAAGSNHISTLSYADGYNRLGSGSGFGVTPLGTLALMGGRVSDDGYVYACNLSGAPASRFVVYRWESDTDFTTPPIVVYDTDAGPSFQWRLGDFMDLRGSGENTEIVVVGNGSGVNITTNFVLFRATDAEATNFTAQSFYVTNVNVMGGGVTFEGTNNVVYLRDTANVTRRVSFDTNAGTATVLSSFTLNAANTRGIKYAKIDDVELIATVHTGVGAAATNYTGGIHTARIFQLTSPTTAVSVFSQPLPAPVSPNNNGSGLVDFQNGHFVFGEINNGIMLYRYTGLVTNTPPSVSLISGGGTYIEGTPVTLSATAGGADPLSYQWYFNTNTLLVGAITNTYNIASVQTSNQGLYSLVVTNPFGVVTSSFAGLTVLPGNFSNFATNLWSLGVGSRPYLTTGDTQRGVAYDAVSNVVVVVSRSPSNAVYLLDADTGADTGNLDVSAIFSITPPGILPINMVGVADDGAVYVGNLLLSGISDSFAIYRWQNADPLASPSQAYLGNPGITRLGDTMAVRGSGVETEILCSFRTGTNVALFTTADGFNFNATVIPVTDLPADAVANGFAGLGLAFGPGNTFWAKSSGFNLRQVAIDTNTLTAQVVATYTNLPGSEAPLGADNVNGYIATVAFGQNPQNLSIWDVSQGEPDAVQLDRELFGSNNPNVNGTGAVAVDVAGGRIFALDSNNGIIAVALPPRMFITPESNGGIVTWSGPGTLQSSTNLALGVWTDLPGVTSPYTNSAAAEIFFRVER